MELKKPHRVKDVFADFRGRRRGLIRALTEEKDKLFEECDPNKDSLCLYGYPNETWEVALPGEMVPPELPEPTLGINIVRDETQGTPNKEWLSTLAAHSDSWLLSVAFSYGTRFGFDQKERTVSASIATYGSWIRPLDTISLKTGGKLRTSDPLRPRNVGAKHPIVHMMELFQMINNLPTLLEVVRGEGKMPKARSSKKTLPHQSQQLKLEETHALPKEKEGSEEEDEHDKTPKDPSGYRNINRRQSSEKTLPRQSQQLLEKMSSMSKEDEEDNTVCGVCDEKDGNEFWICCDTCETWFHGNCVNTTPAEAEHIEKYKCPTCCINK